MIENKVNHTKQKPNYFIFNHWFSKSLKFNVKKVNHTKQNNYSLIEGIIAIKLFNLRVLILSESKNSTSFYSFLFPWTIMH